MSDIQNYDIHLFDPQINFAIFFQLTFFTKILPKKCAMVRLELTNLQFMGLARFQLLHIASTLNYQ